VSADVHPAGAGPLPVPAGTPGRLFSFTERAGIDAVTGRLVMYLRIAQIDDDPADPTAASPGVRLAAGAGPATDVGTAPTPIHTDPAAGPVALATRTDEPDALTLVEVEVLQPGQTWRLQIVNNDGRHHRYVWVVADTDNGTRRPWLDLPTTALAFQATVGETAPAQDLPVVNQGPGPLTLDDPDGTTLGAGFTLLSVTPRPIGLNRRGAARIAFTTPAAPTELAIAHTFASNDPGAGATAGHRNRIALSATVHPAPRWETGDVLMLTQLTLGRLDRATGLPVPVTTSTVGAADVAVDPITGDAVLLGADFVSRVDRFTGVHTPVPEFSTLTDAVGLAVESDGTVVVLDQGVLIRLSPEGARNDTDISVVGIPTAIALEADGGAVVTGERPGAVTVKSVWRINRLKSITEVATGELRRTPAFSARPVVVERTGAILTAQQDKRFDGDLGFSAGSLVRVDPQSGQQQFIIERSLLLADPASLAVTTDGTVLVSAGRALSAMHLQTGGLARLSAVAGARIAVVPPLGTQ
jgi:hypothetical protein